MEPAVSKQLLTDYLKHAMELECSIYQQEKAKKTALSNLKLNTPKKQKINAPVNKADSLLKPEAPAINISKYESDKNIAFFGLLVLALSCFILFIILYNMAAGEAPGAFFLFAFLIFFGIVAWYYSYYSKKKREYEEALKSKADREKKYHADLEFFEFQKKNYDNQYQQDYKIYLHRVNVANDQWNKANNIAESNYHAAKYSISQLDNPLAETKEILEKLYSNNWIFPKYRNMVAMCTIYEYFASGRVSSLEGADGAYNLYEAELRQNIVINNLEKINSNLEAIKYTQYSIYNALQYSNTLLKGISEDISKISCNAEKIVKNTDAIAVSSHITACCSYVTAQNTEALKYLALING